MTIDTTKHRTEQTAEKRKVNGTTLFYYSEMWILKKSIANKRVRVRSDHHQLHEENECTSISSIVKDLTDVCSSLSTTSSSSSSLRN